MMNNNITINRDSTYSSRLAEKLPCFREQQKYTDWKILVGEETIECHANIISAFSPVCERMMATAMTEGINREVAFKTINPDTMKLIINYMYTGEVTLEQSDVVEMLKVCDYLEILELRDRIVRCIPEMLAPDNVIGWKQLAVVFQLDGLLVSCNAMIVKDFKQVTQGQEFLDLSLEELEECLEEATRNNISSDDILHAVFTWINCDLKERVDLLDRILKYVKLEKCSYRCLKDVMTQFKEVLDHNSQLLQKVEHFLQQQSSPLNAALTTMLSIIVIGGKYSRECWALRNDCDFEDLTVVPGDMTGICSSFAVLEGVGFILTGGLQTSVCALFDLVTKKWKSLPSLTADRHYHASLCIHGDLFILGGKIHQPYPPQDHWAYSIEALSIWKEERQWEIVDHMPFLFHFPKATQSDGSVYLMGNSESKLYQFNVLTNARPRWRQMASLHVNPGCGFSLASGSGRVYVAGGDKKICCVYTITANTWTQVTGPQMRHTYGAAVIHEERLVILGGDSDEVEEYDPELDTWDVAPYKLPRRLDFHYAFSMGVPK